MNQHRIVFLSELPREREAKIARGLRSLGVPSALVYVSEPNNHDPREYFNFTLKAQTPEEAVAIVHRMRPDIVHLFSYGADNTAALMIQQKVGRVVYDYKDCYENLVGFTQDPSYYTVQRLLVENADGLCCRDLQLVNYCRVNQIRPRGKRMLFPDYCWGENRGPVPPRRDDEIHVVLAGNFTVERIYPQFADSGYLITSTVLAESGVHVHLYPHWHGPFLKNPDDLADYQALEARTPYFHLHKPVPMKDFTDMLANYDFGLGIFQGNLFPDIPARTVLNRHEWFGMPTRWFDYVEAGLDVLASPSQHFALRMMRNANVGFPATQATLLDGNAKQRLMAIRANLKDLRIAAARKALDIRIHLPRLLAFYRSML